MAAAASAVAPVVFRLLAVSVRVGSVVMGEEDVEVRCWWCCSGLLLTVAPVLWTLVVP